MDYQKLNEAIDNRRIETQCGKCRATAISIRMIYPDTDDYELKKQKKYPALCLDCIKREFQHIESRKKSIEIEISLLENYEYYELKMIALEQKKSMIEKKIEEL